MELCNGHALELSLRPLQFMQCDSQTPISLISGTTYLDPCIQDGCDTVDLCGNYTHGLGIFCPASRGPIHVLQPLSAMFSHAKNGYLRGYCADDCWCLDRPSDDDTAQTSRALGRAHGSTPLNMHGNPEASTDLDAEHHPTGGEGPMDGISGGSFIFCFTIHCTDSVPLEGQRCGESNIEGYSVDHKKPRRVARNANPFGDPLPGHCLEAIKALEAPVGPIEMQHWLENMEFLDEGTSRAFLLDIESVTTLWSKNLSKVHNSRDCRNNSYD